MMNGDRYLEENIQHLLRAGLGERPDTGLKSKTYQLLQEGLLASRSSAEFPYNLLLLFSALLLSVAIWVVSRAFGLLPATSLQPALVLAGLMAALNIVALPLACIVIVKRRRYA
jgi:hypothetical protein